MVFAIVLTVIMCASAHASGKSDLKAGDDALRRNDHHKAISLFTDAIKSGGLSRANLALSLSWR
jgi:hypothetical protein